jgi:hypothetical protein
MENLFVDLTNEEAAILVGGTGKAGEVIPGFVAAWHGVGSDHQANNNPGDTAQDRHNFEDATAGGSDINPTY